MKIKGNLTFPTPSPSVPGGQIERVFVEQVSVLPTFEAEQQGRLVYDTNTNTFWYNDATSWVEIVVGPSGGPTGPEIITVSTLDADESGFWTINETGETPFYEHEIDSGRFNKHYVITHATVDAGQSSSLKVQQPLSSSGEYRITHRGTGAVSLNTNENEVLVRSGFVLQPGMTILVQQDAINGRTSIIIEEETIAAAPVSTDNVIVDLGSVGGTIAINLSLGKTFLADITANVTDIIYTGFDEQSGTKTYEYDLIITQGGYAGDSTLTLPALEYFAIGDSALQLAQGANSRTLMTAKSIGDGTWIYALQPLA